MNFQDRATGAIAPLEGTALGDNTISVSQMKHSCRCCISTIFVFGLTAPYCVFMFLCFQSMFRQGDVMVLQSVTSGKTLSIYEGRLSGKGTRDKYCKRCNHPLLDI